MRNSLANLLLPAAAIAAALLLFGVFVAFAGASPLEVWHGASTLGMSLPRYLSALKSAGLGSLPGTAAEVQPIRSLAGELSELNKGGPHVLTAYLRNVRLALIDKAQQIYLEARPNA